MAKSKCYGIHSIDVYRKFAVSKIKQPIWIYDT